jgi:hypothetical protein
MRILVYSIQRCGANNCRLCCQGSEAVEGLILNLLVLDDVHLKTEAFVKIKNLRLLQINGVHLIGCFEHLSKELRWLCWHKCPLKFLPQNFHLENLVVLDMQHSNIKQVWKEIKIVRIKTSYNAFYFFINANCRKISIMFFFLMIFVFTGIQ